MSNYEVIHSLVALPVNKLPLLEGLVRPGSRRCKSGQESHSLLHVSGDGDSDVPVGERLLSARPRAPSSAGPRKSCYRRPFMRQKHVQEFRTSSLIRYCNDIVLITHRFRVILLYLEIELLSTIVNVNELGCWSLICQLCHIVRFVYLRSICCAL